MRPAHPGTLPSATARLDNDYLACEVCDNALIIGRTCAEVVK